MQSGRVQILNRNLKISSVLMKLTVFSKTRSLDSNMTTNCINLKPLLMIHLHLIVKIQSILITAIGMILPINKMITATRRTTNKITLVVLEAHTNAIQYGKVLHFYFG